MTQSVAAPHSDALERLAKGKVAFISVFDKTGIEPVAKALVEQYGYTLLSTGGTRTYLEERGVPVIESSEITGFGELLGGRVKSLHPSIFAGILAERDKPMDGVPFLIDTVIVSLYPFEKEAKTPEALQDEDYLTHFIDIGGSALIRSAAKNHRFVNVIHSADQYEAFLQALEAGQGTTSDAFRKQLAYSAFQRSVRYDAAILQFFHRIQEDESAAPTLEDTLVLPLSKIQDLRYGENPHQQAALYGLGRSDTPFNVLHGKELSYNNILDMESAWKLICEFEDTPACAIIKHNTPCGVAMSPVNIETAYQMALDADPVSAFGGIVALSRPVSLKLAESLKEIFLEVIIAPDFAEDALTVLMTKKNLRLVTCALEPASQAETPMEYRQVAADLLLAQSVAADKNPHITEERLTAVTNKKPTPAQAQDLLFAWKVAKHVKSNAIVLAKEGRTVGISGGQTSRIGALENAIRQACDDAKDAVMASDGFLPAEDNIYAAAQVRIAAIIQPGGSIKDKDVIALANQYDIAMVTTGIREFRH